MDSRAFLSLSLSFLLLLVLFPHPSHSSLRRWLTEKERHGSVLRLKKGTSYAGFDPTRVTQLSWSPRAFIYRGFLSHEECDHLIDLAKDKLEKSMVADNESGKSIESEVRTSSGMFLKKAQSLKRHAVGPWTMVTSRPNFIPPSREIHHYFYFDFWMFFWSIE